jgi:hypothetical protein
MTFRVDAATPSDQGGIGWARYSGSIIGGGVTIGSLAWTFGGHADNYVVIWNDQPVFNLLLEGIDFEAPVDGPTINDFYPVSISAMLLHFGTVPSDALTSLSFPTSLDLADFDAAANGAFYFSYGLNFGYYLDLHDVRVTPEPPTPLLFALALATMMYAAATASRAARARPS